MPRNKLQTKKEKTKVVKEYLIGYFHINTVQVNTVDDRLYMFVAVDRTTKFACVELHSKQTREIAALFLENSIAKEQYKIHTD